MKKIINYIAIVFFSVSTIQAQQNRPGQPIGGIVVKGGKNPGGSMLLNVSGGLSSPTSDYQSKNFIGRGFNVNAGFYAPLIMVNQFVTVGPNVGGNFSKFQGDLNMCCRYTISGQSAATASKSNTGNASVINLEAGVQANFSIGKITFSPILNGAYFSYQQNAFDVTQTNQVNGTSYNFDVYKQNKIAESGFAFIPKLRAGYFPGKLGFYLEGNYTFGPNVTTEYTEIIPVGEGDIRDGSYKLDQLLSGKQEASGRHTPFHNFAVNFGLTYAVKTLKGRAKNAGKGNRAESVTAANPYLKDDKIQRALPNSIKGQNPLYEPKDDTTMNPLLKLAMTYTHDYTVTDAKVLNYLHTDKLTIAKGTYTTDFSENPFGDITLKLASPISAKGINQAGLKRTVEAPANEKGITEKGIKRTVEAPANEKSITEKGIKRSGEATANEKGITEKGIKKSDEAPANRKGITEKGIKRSVETPANEKGITEKGIKRSVEAPVNDKGINQAELTPKKFSGYRCDEGCKEEGTYCFTCKVGASTGLFYEFEIVPVIENDMITKITLSNTSISENGTPLPLNWMSKKGYDTWKAASNMNAAKAGNPLYQHSDSSGTNPLFQASPLGRPGEPIGGIVVKGGRNPGGQLKLVSDNDGSFSFDNAATADFQFTIEIPETKSDGANAARPGGPIGGIVVKGGRNPGGSNSYVLISDPQGTISLKNLPAGHYKFRITVPAKEKLPQ